MSINLSALQVKTSGSPIVGILEFYDISGSPYCMANENGSQNAGISFIYEGGKFSCPIEPDIANELDKASAGKLLEFSKVRMSAVPASFGREKRAGMRPKAILSLECNGQLLFQSLADTEPRKPKK